MSAWYSAGCDEFLATPRHTIAAQLAARQAQRNLGGNAVGQAAWLDSVALLQTVLRHPDAAGWTVLLEYELERVGKRADAIVLTDRAIFVLEFKAGQNQADAASALRQADDYAQDLFDFHAGSRTAAVVPIAVGRGFATTRVAALPMTGCVLPAQLAKADDLLALMRATHASLPTLRAPLEAGWWQSQPYDPVPGIIEAARMAFARQAAPGIDTTIADRGSLLATTDAILELVAGARDAGERLVIFVTGIPGAGKTRCGLGVAFESSVQSRAVFLTGNPTLVHVFRAALVRDAVARGAQKRAAEQQMEQRIQALPLFRDLYVSKPDHSPPEHVIVVDEAQRSWSAPHAIRKTRDRDTRLTDSEAGHILDAMSRVPGWSAIICLVGGGQEIHDGEGGLAEWSDALLRRPAWRTASAELAFTSDDPRQRLAPSPRHQTSPRLHLATSIRSLRGSHLPDWVNALLRGDEAAARQVATQHPLPVFLTRDLPAMRAALRDAARGYRRAGLLVSSGAARMRAHGLGVELAHMDKDAVARWFLDTWPQDVRASDALEVAANEFSCQGLELDHAGLAWGADLIRARAGWEVRRFHGTDWEVRRSAEAIANRLNTYRVLLTRARYLTVIWVPRGQDADRTQPPAAFDRIADFLTACGARPLADMPAPAAPKTVPAFLL